MFSKKSKKIFSLLVCLGLYICASFLTSQKATAQVSLSVAGRYQKFVVGDDIFPYGEVRDFPAFVGLETRLNLGISYKLALSLEGSYMMGTKKGEFVYSNMIRTTNTAATLNANLRYYLLGAYNDRGGFYTWAGFDGGMYNIDWKLDEGERNGGRDPFPEPEYFQDRQFWLLGINAGMGTEVYVGSFYIFADGGFSYRFKDYVSNVTTYEPHLRHFWKANIGVRIPFGGNL